VPWAGAGSIRFGTNTPSVEVRNEKTDALLVLDAGTGIVALADDLGERPRSIAILLTHYHWDHVQGLPFFQPVFDPGWDLAIWGPALAAGDVRSISTVFRPPFFTMEYGELPSAPRFHTIGAGSQEVAGFDLSAFALTHPGGALGYRIRGDAGDLVYATDHEFGAADVDEGLASFARGAAHVVIDAHFTPEEAAAVKGWGHSTWKRAAEFAAEAGVGHLWLFHHKPGRSDREIEAIESRAREIFPATDAAAEGVSFDF
jgi:ribonuclease BN (tRNA processing enzyme)